MTTLDTSAALTSRAQPFDDQDRWPLSRMVVRTGTLIDLRLWHNLTDLFDERVRVDLPCILGGRSTTLTRGDLISKWRAAVEHFDATQHLVTATAVIGDAQSVSSRAHLRATHWLGERSWTVGGAYAHRFARTPCGWRMTAIALRRVYVEGDHTLAFAG